MESSVALAGFWVLWNRKEYPAKIFIACCKGGETPQSSEINSNLEDCQENYLNQKLARKPMTKTACLMPINRVF